MDIRLVFVVLASAVLIYQVGPTHAHTHPTQPCAPEETKTAHTPPPSHLPTRLQTTDIFEGWHLGHHDQPVEHLVINSQSQGDGRLSIGGGGPAPSHANTTSRLATPPPLAPVNFTTASVTPAARVQRTTLYISHKRRIIVNVVPITSYLALIFCENDIC